MSETILKFLNRELPNWIRNLFYAILLLETVSVVIIYFRPDLWVEFIKLFS